MKIDQHFFLNFLKDWFNGSDSAQVGFVRKYGCCFDTTCIYSNEADTQERLMIPEFLSSK